MNSETLIALMNRFLTDDFGTAQAEELWGQVTSDTNPLVLGIQSNREGIERVDLLMLDMHGNKLLAGISIKLSDAMTFDVEGLVTAYGRPRLLPRLKPDQPIPYVFHVKGTDFAGDLLIGLEPNRPKVPKIRTIRLTRYFPTGS